LQAKLTEWTAALWERERGHTNFLITLSVRVLKIIMNVQLGGALVLALEKLGRGPSASVTSCRHKQRKRHRKKGISAFLAKLFGENGITKLFCCYKTFYCDNKRAVASIIFFFLNDISSIVALAELFSNVNYRPGCSKEEALAIFFYDSENAL